MNVEMLRSADAPQRLLQGSRNIERMKKEIVDLTSTLADVLRERWVDLRYMEVHKTFATDKEKSGRWNEWLVKGTFGLLYPSTNLIEISCTHCNESGGQAYRKLIFTNKTHIMRLADIQTVHESLGTLIDGMQMLFLPNDIFEPLLRASKVKFD